jgi:hypothetical protein
MLTPNHDGQRTLPTAWNLIRGNAPYLDGLDFAGQDHSRGLPLRGFQQA